MISFRRGLVVLLALLSLGICQSVMADPLVQSVQSQLKDKGFYYGAVDGLTGPETTAAIRRYQIRNGLEVTGTLTEETLRSLRGGGTLPPPTSEQRRDASSDLRAPPEDYEERDQEFLDGQRGRTPPRVVEPPETYRDDYVAPPAPATIRDASSQFQVLFSGTRYERAPLEVQEDILRSAQAELADHRFYRGAIDGIPGPETARAIHEFQDYEGLRRTGRLDNDTLDELDLLRPRHRVQRRIEIQISPHRIFRGLWVD